LLITLLALSWGGNWLVNKFMDYTIDMVHRIPQIVG
jgi:flagellar biosynthetic protein FliQ